MKTLIITAVYDGLDIEETPLYQSLGRLGYSGGLHVARAEGNIGNRQRMFAYAQGLQEAGPETETVILTDARDVVFQGDPEAMEHGDLDVFLEDENKTIGSCPINRRNYTDEYGEAEFRKVQDCPVSCAGVVIGSRAGIERYLAVFCAEVDRCRKDVPWSQPLHNHLLWQGAFNPVRMISNEDAAVYTVGHCAELRVREHLILNQAGRVPFMVHQFDRHLTTV